MFLYCSINMCPHFCHWFSVSLSSITECKKTTPKLGKTMQYLSIIPIAIKDYKSNDEYVVYLKQMVHPCTCICTLYHVYYSLELVPLIV